MRLVLIPALTLAFTLLNPFAHAAEIPVLAYHDIVPTKNGDAYAITVDEFERQMAYLRSAGYQPIGLRALDKVCRGKASLPAKPVLLTFDDGYKSYYRYAFPLLQKYGFPSVVSIVTSWVDRRSAPDYGTGEIMTWEDLRVVARSPLVQVLSHTDDLHFNVLANPFGAHMPAAITRIYDPVRGVYESDAAHRRRVTADLARSVARLKKELGVAPIGIAWPYGKYEQALIDAAAGLGMRYHLTLDDEPTRLADLPRINRETFRDYRTLADLGSALSFRDHRRQQLRFVEIDLAAIADLPAGERAGRIAELTRRAVLLRVDAVLLRPFAADGRAYFQNSAVPVAADLLSLVAHELENDAGLEYLYLSIPATADAAAYRDLARLNWFTDVAFEGVKDRILFERAANALRHYKPALKIGVRAPQAPADLETDFILVDLPTDAAPDTLARTVDQVLSANRQALFLLNGASRASVAQLRDAMAVLRSRGAAHYGYGLDDYAGNTPPALAIVRSLTEHTVVRSPR